MPQESPPLEIDVTANAIHSFRIIDAETYDVHCAVIIFNFMYWIELNRVNNKHFHDGRYWTYSSVEALSKVFYYLSPKQVRYSLKKLIDDGVLVKGNYNAKGYDRTTWYSFSDKFGKSIYQKRQIHLTKKANAIANSGQPIPANKTNSKPHKERQDLSDKKNLSDSLYKDFIDVYHKWYLELNGFPPHIDGMAGKAAKQLIQFFRGVVRTKNQTLEADDLSAAICNAFRVLLFNWHLIEPFLRGKYKLSEISSNINNIIPQIKSAYEKTTPTRPEDWRDIIKGSRTSSNEGRTQKKQGSESSDTPTS